MEEIKRLIDEIYVKKNNTVQNRKSLILELSEYISKKYYNLAVQIKFSDVILGGVAISLGKEVYFCLPKLNMIFENKNGLLELLFLIGHELGHSYNYKNGDLMILQNKYENIIYLLNAKYIPKNYIEPTYNDLIIEKDIYLSNSRIYYRENYDFNLDENMANYNSTLVTEDVLIDLGLYSDFENEINLKYQKYNDLLKNKQRKKDNIDSNIDILFDELEDKDSSVVMENILFRREYNKNLKRKKTSQLLLELYKIIYVLENRKMEFKKFDILEKRKNFYFDLILKRNMNFEERLEDINDLIAYNPLFINIIPLKIIIINNLLDYKFSNLDNYNDEQLSKIQNLLNDYLKSVEIKMSRNK